MALLCGAGRIAHRRARKQQTLCGSSCIHWRSLVKRTPSWRSIGPATLRGLSAKLGLAQSITIVESGQRTPLSCSQPPSGTSTIGRTSHSGVRSRRVHWPKRCSTFASGWIIFSVSGMGAPCCGLRPRQLTFEQRAHRCRGARAKPPGSAQSLDICCTIFVHTRQACTSEKLGGKQDIRGKLRGPCTRIGFS